MSGFTPLLRLYRTPASIAPDHGKSRSMVNKYRLLISCRVKPNTSGDREGITAINAERLDVNVAAAPRKGEANAAISRVLAQILGVPKSNVDVIQGLKSRDKTLCIMDLDIRLDGEEIFLQETREKLEKAIVKK